jgi:homoserine kinase
MALGLYNIIEMERAEDVVVTVEGEGAGKLPQDATNLVCRAAKTLWERVDFPQSGLKVHLTNQIPLSRGLGSSAAATVGSLVAANLLSGSRLSADEILALATEFEGHPDNAAPALFGGFVVSVVEGDQVRAMQLAVPPRLRAVVAIPEFELSTDAARRALPKEVSIEDATFNLSRCAMLVGALATGQLRFLRSSFHDKLHEPYRAHLIPGMAEVTEAGLREGARGVVLSGAGPTMIAFYTGRERGGLIGTAMQKAFANAGVDSKILLTSLVSHGARVA